MTVREIDPIRDPAWLALADRHARGSAFHTPSWLEALKRTYGYDVVALTTSPSGAELSDGIVFCRISSWLTGRRIVSLPFSDHCEPLVGGREELSCILTSVGHGWKSKGWKYMEMRPIEGDLGTSPGLSASKTYCLHRLNLRPSQDDLFRGFHKDCVQRKIRRAESEALTCEEGRSDDLLKRFYRLLVVTRRRQRLVPPPLAWFRNLVDCMGEKLKIHVASKDSQPVAAILTLSHRATLTYKYSCSDRRFSSLGGTQLLLWHAIREAKRQGLTELDLGRSDWDNPGLIAFKDRWGAIRSTLTYWRCGEAASERAPDGLPSRIARHAVSYASDWLLAGAGRCLYRHVG
jgi:Acetyltransferase (GNAT) domain